MGGGERFNITVVAALRWLGALTVLVAVACGGQSQRDGAAPPVSSGGAGSPGAAGGSGGSTVGGFAIDWELASDILSTAPTTVAIVTWSLDKPGIIQAHIDFGLDTTYGMTAPVDLGELDGRTVLVGMKPARTYHFQIVATDGTHSYTSSDQTLTTGAPTTLIPPATVSVVSPGQVDKGFIIGSFWTGEAATVRRRYSSSIRTARSSGGTRTRTSPAGTMASGGRVCRPTAMTSGSSNAQRATSLRRVSLDTLDVQDYAAGGTHDICAVSGDTMAYLDTNKALCASIVEIDKSGTTKLIFDSTTAAAPNVPWERDSLFRGRRTCTSSRTATPTSSSSTARARSNGSSRTR